MSRHDLTAHVAYTIFAQRGYAHGRHVEDWFAAEGIVALCEQMLTALLGPEQAPAEDAAVTAAPTVDRTALAIELLEAAVAAKGRKAVAGKLGYKSTSSVGKYLRGDRAPTEALVEKILEAFGQRARRAA